MFFNVFRKTKNGLQTPEPNDVNQQLVLSLNKRRWPNWSQFKQMPKLLSKVEKQQIVVALLIFLLSAGIFSWRLYTHNTIEVPDDGGSYTEGLLGTAHLINPILATSQSDRDIVRLVYSGLMKFDATGQLVPDLASSYTINADQTIYMFELRDDLRWHDGQPVTADDVIFTVSNIKNTDYN